MAEKKVIDPNTGITIVPERDNRLTEFSKKLITDYYLKDEETIQEGFARAAFAWSSDDEHAQRLYDAVSQGWFMFASPVLSNAPKAIDNINRIFDKAKGLPISCFSGYVQDSVDGLINHTSEVRWLSVMGGGVGAAWSDIRSSSKKSPGPIPFIHTLDADMEAYTQSRTRRGSYAAYMDVSHPDIIEFINLRVPTGDVSRKCHSAGFHNAVNITDDFMKAVLDDAEWNLIDPHDKTVRDTLSARDLWNQILDIRYRTGEPYLHFIDTANKWLPEIQKKLGLEIKSSNLCVSGDTIIDIDHNGKKESIRIDDFNEKYSMGFYDKVLVKSYDIAKNAIVWEEIVASAQTGIADELYEIESDDGKYKIRCTAEHKIFTKNRGYVEAQYLTENDDLIFS